MKIYWKILYEFFYQIKIWKLLHFEINNNNNNLNEIIKRKYRQYEMNGLKRKKSSKSVRSIEFIISVRKIIGYHATNIFFLEKVRIVSTLKSLIWKIH